MKRLILASTSRYRRALLDQVGVPYQAVAPLGEEDHSLELSTDEFVQELAARKAQSLGERFPDGLIIGADQVAELGGARLFKPGTPERAVQQLMGLAGRTHRLVTGLAVYEPESGRTERAVDVHHMTMRSLTEAQVRAYVAHERPVDCAGSYKVEGLGVVLFSAMAGDDHTGIVGLPITKLTVLLERFGAELLSSEAPSQTSLF